MSRKRKNGIWLTVAAISVSLLAGLGAYKGARLLADGMTTEAEKNAEKAGLFKPEGLEEGISSKIVSGEKTVNKICPLTLVYVTDYESGKIENLAVQVFDTVGMKVSFITLDPEIMYTMTGTLYRALANGNVLVPQTVKMRELYGYYGNPAAYEAGRKIVSELLGTDIDHYTALSKEKTPEAFTGGEIKATDLKMLFDAEDRETSFSKEEEKVYSELYEYLEDPDVKVYEAPVISRNESCFVDVTGVWEILAEVLPVVED